MQLQYAKMYALFSFMAWICDFIPNFEHFYGFDSDPYEPNVPKVALITYNTSIPKMEDPMANMVYIFVGI